ncbi:hypothetical protein AB8Z38_29340 [Bradyrhizobium sp. LLZ17]|uniref:Uncharacterized protein n=1 Tax=Bradyrhizobium sp. LLZ17 TaxID=3239388 RepID=A0AB39XFM0_9BRAD
MADLLRKQPRTTLAGPLNRSSWRFLVSLVNDGISDMPDSASSWPSARMKKWAADEKNAMDLRQHSTICK